MAKAPRKTPSYSRASALGRLVQTSAAFTDKTRVTENSLDVRKGIWRLGFDNGYAILVRSDGRCKVVREKTRRAQVPLSSEH